MTARMILKLLRQRNPDRKYKTMRGADWQMMIVSRPDFERVPYDKLRDFWSFEAWVKTAPQDLQLTQGH